MKVKALLGSVLIVSVTTMVSGCATSDIQAAIGNGSATTTLDTKLPPTNPKNVKLYFGNQGTPRNYRVIGHVTASNYTVIGTSYSQDSISNELKKQAASIGGTGVININTGLDRTTGDVIVK